MPPLILPPSNPCRHIGAAIRCPVGVLFLHEVVTLTTLFGAAMILLGMALVLGIGLPQLGAKLRVR